VCADCSMGEVSLAVQLLFVGTVLLVIEVDMLALDPLKLVYLCAECMYVGYHSGVP